MSNIEGINVGGAPFAPTAAGQARRDKKIEVVEIFRSIQGESTYAGWPCTFIRCAGCNLNCLYCDTQQAKQAGELFSIEELVGKVNRQSSSGLVEITGGEPLLQENIAALAQALLDDDHQVLLETNGCCDISNLPSQVVKIMDIKCPSSGEADKMLWSNLDKLKPKDQIKFVLSDKSDYDYAKEIINRYSLAERSTLLMGCVWDGLSLKELSEWILTDNLPVIINTQLHKYIWGSNTRNKISGV